MRNGWRRRAGQGRSRKTPRLFIDVSVIARGDAGTGIQRVVRAFWLELIQIDPRYFEVLPVAGSKRKQYRIIDPHFLEHPLSHLPLGLGRRRIRARAGDIFLGLDLSAHIVPRHTAQFQAWRSAGMRSAFLIYDLLPIRHPEWFSDRSANFFRQWASTLATHADVLACISENVANEVRTWLAETGHANSELPYPKVSAIKLGVPMAAMPQAGELSPDEQSILAWARSGHTIIMVGTIEPRKGHDQVLGAFEHLWKKYPNDEWNLLIIGRPGWKTEKLQESISRNPFNGVKLQWIRDSDDNFLNELYKACSGAVVASRGEGLGLPLLEAARLGKPVLARDLAVFREIAPDGVCFFKADTADGLASALRGWRDKGQHTSLAPSLTGWRRGAEQLMQVLTGLSHEKAKGLW
jgi:glycosyltransferase involved in cell wall biosynthesis